MTPLFPAQRAAEEFDQVLAGTATRAVSDRYAELLEAVSVLRAQPEVLPRAEFVGELRTRLMTAAETELVPVPSVVRELRPQRAPRPSRRLGTVAASLVIVGGTAGMAAAASGSLPGEALYPVKRGVEQVTTAAHLSDAGKGKALLDQAATRLQEVRDLQAQGSPDAELVASTLDSFRTAAEDGSDKLFASYQATSDTEDITAVRTFTAEQMKGISELSGTSSATDELLVDAADTVADIDQQARVLCAACEPGTALSLPEALSAGAGGASVESLLARPVNQAQVDIAAADKARVARLKALAEKRAGEVPTAATSGVTGAPDTIAAEGEKLTSTITPDGKLAPALPTSGTQAVKGLVSGVTSTVTGVTTSVTGGKTALDPVVKGLTDTVDGLVDDVRPEKKNP
jgi:hypothetical protein